jgi:hypothetical protein
VKRRAVVLATIPVVVATILACALPGSMNAAAATFALADAQKRQAVEYGRQSAHRENFDAEWRVTQGDETVVVMTPFHRLAIAARHAAFRDEPLRPSEPDRLLREQKDRVVFAVELRGRQEDFTRFYVPELQLGPRKIKASFVQNERTPARADDGGYLARCVYAFPIKELTGTSRVALVVRDADGRETRRFTIDLGAMR